MNERIQVLADQAKNSVPQGTLDVDKWIEVYNQKFAELIVRECIETMYNTEQMNVAKFVALTLQEHFGLEE